MPHRRVHTEHIICQKLGTQFVPQPALEYLYLVKPLKILPAAIIEDKGKIPHILEKSEGVKFCSACGSRIESVSGHSIANSFKRHVQKFHQPATF
jgi:hypothetical protein